PPRARPPRPAPARPRPPGLHRAPRLPRAGTRYPGGQTAVMRAPVAPCRRGRGTPRRRRYDAVAPPDLPRPPLRRGGDPAATITSTGRDRDKHVTAAMVIFAALRP